MIASAAAADPASEAVKTGAASLAATTVTIKEGTTLASVATATYGHPKFAPFLARLNGIANPDNIASGTVLKTPSLIQGLKDAGLDPRYQAAADSLAKAWASFQAASPAYQKARDASGITSGKFPIPAEMSGTFSATADAVDAGVKVLSNPDPDHHAPRKSIGQLTQCASQLRRLATGEVDGYGYDQDMVGQRFALAFTGLLVWVQERHQ